VQVPSETIDEDGAALVGMARTAVIVSGVLCAVFLVAVLFLLAVRVKQRQKWEPDAESIRRRGHGALVAGRNKGGLGWLNCVRQVMGWPAREGDDMAAPVRSTNTIPLPPAVRLTREYVVPLRDARVFIWKRLRDRRARDESERGGQNVGWSSSLAE
jgi:hypothetical protein